MEQKYEKEFRKLKHSVSTEFKILLFIYFLCGIIAFGKNQGQWVPLMNPHDLSVSADLGT